MNKCIRAKKAFLLLSNGIVHDKIGDDIFLNEKVLSVPSKGTEVYKISRDTSTLSFPVEESKLHLLVCQDDKDNVCALKRTHIVFDEEFPYGAPPGVLSVVHKQLHKKKSNMVVHERIQ